MSKRLNLREFQQSLSDRMQAHNRVRDQASTLGLIMAGQHCLIEMSDISEVLPVPQMTKVPLSKGWFRGVANIRGNLYCISDVAAFLQKGDVVDDSANRILIVSEKHAINVALLVDRVLGLRDARKWNKRIHDGQVEYQDSQNISWRKLDISDLINLR